MHPRTFTSELVGPHINADIAPTKVSERTWNTSHIAALWIGMCVCIPTYMLAAGLIAGGMNWWQAVLTITLGNFIVLVPMILKAHAGTKYGIPFPVLTRAPLGTLGANIPAVGLVFKRGSGARRSTRCWSSYYRSGKTLSSDHG